jgi:hypothetical protein
MKPVCSKTSQPQSTPLEMLKTLLPCKTIHPMHGPSTPPNMGPWEVPQPSKLAFRPFPRPFHWAFLN